ncbi:MAG: MBL fold metallo-hydrolase [Oscillospiraceae bacterium]
MKVVTIAVGPLATNCYLVISDQHNAAVIDPGFNAPLILQHVRSLGAQVQMISCLRTGTMTTWAPCGSCSR